MARGYGYGYNGQMLPFGGAALTGLYMSGPYDYGNGGGYGGRSSNGFSGRSSTANGGRSSTGFSSGSGLSSCFSGMGSRINTIFSGSDRGSSGTGSVSGFGGRGRRRSRHSDGYEDHRDWSTNYLRY
ncbi:hypothetical protein B0A54_06090 [Friedmanniomyces endolithicus]|uniref:Uncharacterized protein n=1 Tax=Friedmanniomyces endolithicus TaxID=329885 RepID=A0A4U0V4B7_9PEZI|nr:hypothetical protein B0A54_06090 [Friedmanniomyces endolithicus]